MSVSLSFSIRFHGPFRVATGLAAPGVDATVDLRHPLPATAMKGLARHAARVQLALPSDLVDDVFGTAAHPSPWSWGDGQFPPGALVTSVQAQVRIDPTTGTAHAAERALLFGEQLWCKPNVTATLDVELTSALPRERLEDHLAVVVGAMCSVHSLGSSRRRGLGRVTVRLEGTTGPGAGDMLGTDWAAQVARSLAARTV